VQLRGGRQVALHTCQLEQQAEQGLVLRQRQRRHKHAQRPGHLRPDGEQSWATLDSVFHIAHSYIVQRTRRWRGIETRVVDSPDKIW